MNRFNTQNPTQGIFFFSFYLKSIFLKTFFGVLIDLYIATFRTLNGSSSGKDAYIEYTVDWGTINDHILVGIHGNKSVNKLFTHFLMNYKHGNNIERADNILLIPVH